MRGGDLVERYGGVGEAGRVGGLAGPDQGPDRVADVPDVDVHPGDDAAARQPERDELALGHVAADDHPA